MVYYRAASDDLYRVEANTLVHYTPSSGFRFTRSTQTYHKSFEEPLPPKMDHGSPISVTGLVTKKVVKLSTSPSLAMEANSPMSF